MSKLLFYIENNVAGGANKYMADLIDGIKKSGIKSSIYCNSGGFFKTSDPTEEVKYINILSCYYVSQLKSLTFNRLIHLLVLIIQLTFLLLNVFVFFKLLIREKPKKIIICNGGYPAALSCLSLAFASKIMMIPCIMSIVSVPVARRRFITWLDKFIDRLVSKSLESVVVNCFAAKKNLIELRNFSDDKIIVIRNGIEKLTDNNKSHVFTSTGITIGCVSRMDYNKGMIYLLEAFIEVRKKHPSAKLILVGTGNAYKELAKKILEAKLGSCVSLIGFYEGQVADIMNGLDIFVLPSLWEGLPYSIIEACRSECAIIATDVGGVNEIIEHNKTGLLIKVKSVSEIYDSIIYLIENPNIAKKLASSARSNFEQNFTIEIMHKLIKKEILKV